MHLLTWFYFRIDKNVDAHKDSVKDVNDGGSDKAQEPSQVNQKQAPEEKKDHPPILKYIKTQVIILYNKMSICLLKPFKRSFPLSYFLFA